MNQWNKIENTEYTKMTSGTFHCIISPFIRKEKNFFAGGKIASLINKPGEMGFLHARS